MCVSQPQLFPQNCFIQLISRLLAGPRSRQFTKIFIYCPVGPLKLWGALWRGFLSRREEAKQGIPFLLLNWDQLWSQFEVNKLLGMGKTAKRSAVALWTVYSLSMIIGAEICARFFFQCVVMLDVGKISAFFGFFCSQCCTADNCTTVASDLLPILLTKTIFFGEIYRFFVFLWCLKVHIVVLLKKRSNGIRKMLERNISFHMIF